MQTGLQYLEQIRPNEVCLAATLLLSPKPAKLRSKKWDISGKYISASTSNCWSTSHTLKSIVRLMKRRTKDSPLKGIEINGIQYACRTNRHNSNACPKASVFDTFSANSSCSPLETVLNRYSQTSAKVDAASITNLLARSAAEATVAQIRCRPLILLCQMTRKLPFWKNCIDRWKVLYALGNCPALLNCLR